MKTVLMAGGKGTRISSDAADIPKPLIKIEGVPVLEREIICLRDQGFTAMILTVSHMADKIMSYFGDDSRFGVDIEYFVEEQPLGNAGLHVIDPAVLDIAATTVAVEKIGSGVEVDLDRQILKPLCGTGKMFCYDSRSMSRIWGHQTPDRYEAVCRDFRDGVVQAKNLRNKQKAIFLDRDGTINKYVGFLRNIDEFELLPGVAEAIKRINSSGYLCIVVTNPPVIARGEVTVPELRGIHDKMETLLGTEGAYIDGLYYCPHHPHKGYEGEIPELKIDCSCRKPKPGMLLQAAEDFNIDLSQSWMNGDGENDIKAGKAAGCHTSLIGNEDYGQDMTVSSLLKFTERF